MFYRLTEAFDNGLIDPRHLDFLQNKPEYLERSASVFSCIELPGEEKFVVEEGDFPDIVQTGFVNQFLISQKFFNLLTIEKISGISLFPVTLLNVKLQMVDHQYFALCVKGRSGPMKWYAKKNERNKEYPSAYREGFDIKSWDGSDIFLCETLNPGIFCTEKVKSSLEEANLSNLMFYSLDVSMRLFNLDAPEIVWED